MAIYMYRCDVLYLNCHLVNNITLSTNYNCMCFIISLHSCMCYSHSLLCKYTCSSLFISLQTSFSISMAVYSYFYLINFVQVL